MQKYSLIGGRQTGREVGRQVGKWVGRQIDIQAGSQTSSLAPCVLNVESLKIPF